MHFPRPEETIRCPYCAAMCAYASPNTATITYAHGMPDQQDRTVHTVEVAHCRSCGKPIIQYRILLHGKTTPHVEAIYPIAPNRQNTPEEVREAAPDLAKDYDEAVACEPHSLQASASLLGRCASEILVSHCGAKRKDLLGKQVNDAKQAGKLPPGLEHEIDGLREGRNQASHPWYSETGERLEVDGKTLEWCFEIVDMMIDHFIVRPKTTADRMKRFEALKAAKVAGDRVA